MSEKRKQEARGDDDEPGSSVAKKAKTEEEEKEHEEEEEEAEKETDLPEEKDSDGDSDEVEFSGELPSSEEEGDDDDDDDDDVDEEELSDGGGAIIEGLEMELKKMDDGKYLVLETDDTPKELKLVIPSAILVEISTWCKEKFAEGCIPVVDAKDIEVVTNIDEELVCHAEILEAAEALDKSDKEVEQALKEEWIVVRIEGHSETFGTLHFAASDEGEGEQ